MTRIQLLAAVHGLYPTGPLSDRLGTILRPGPYPNQRMHWLNWLRGHPASEASYIYNHLLCAPMLLWLAEASGVPVARLERAVAATLAAGPPPAHRCRALRRVIPWEVVRARLAGQ